MNESVHPSVECPMCGEDYVLVAQTWTERRYVHTASDCTLSNVEIVEERSRPLTLALSFLVPFALAYLLGRRRSAHDDVNGGDGDDD